MALQLATLSSAITANQVIFGLSSAPSNVPAVGALALPIGVPAVCDSEIMFIVAQPATNLITVRRGCDGTAASAHDNLANINIGLTAADFPAPQPGTTVTTDFSEDAPISIATDGAISLPGANSVFNINKVTALAGTLAAPSLADNGVVYSFTSNTAAAHVITATGLILDGSASVKNTMTFSGQKGATISVVVENGFFNVNGAPQNVTLA